MKNANVKALAQVVVDTCSDMVDDPRGNTEYSEGVLDAYAALIGTDSRDDALAHAHHVVDDLAEAAYLLRFYEDGIEHLVYVWPDGTGEVTFRFSPAERWSTPTKMESAR